MFKASRSGKVNHKYKTDRVFYATKHRGPERLPGMIKSFQLSKGQEKKEYFFEILILVETLIKRQIGQLQRKVPHLNCYSVSDLFQSSVIALYQACDVFDVDKFKFTGFPIYVKGYIINEFKKTFSPPLGFYSKTDIPEMYMNCSIDGMECRRSVVNQKEAVMFHARLIVEYLRSKKIISDEAFEILNLHYFKDINWEEIAVMKNIPRRSLMKRRYRWIKKIQKYLKMKGYVEILGHLNRG